MILVTKQKQISKTKFGYQREKGAAGDKLGLWH